MNLAYREFGNRTALHAAAASGHLAIVHILVQSGAALDKFDQSQNTALTLAISQEQNNVVKYLIQAGCSTVLKVPYLFLFHLCWLCSTLILHRAKVG